MVEKNKNKKEDYTAKDIYVLKGLEPVRRRPGMYIGTTGPEGLHHLVYEVVDNSLDEALAGYADLIELELRDGNRVWVRDNGRGIPVDIHSDTKKSALETVMTTLHAGGKFGGQSYKIAGGLHGVGVSVVTALSKYLRAEVCRDGALYAQEYSQGKVKTKLKKEGPCKVTGTAIEFEPDPEIFFGNKVPKEPVFSFKKILEHLRQQAYLTPGLKMELRDRRSERGPDKELPREYSFYFEGGLMAFVKYLNRGEPVEHPGRTKRAFWLRRLCSTPEIYNP
jgi:DNA gyrase subunit B